MSISINNRFRLFFAVQFAGVGIFFPYIALYLNSIGLSGAQVGLLLALVPLTAFVAQPLWGMAMDINHQHRLALVFACVSVCVVMLVYASVTQFWLLVPLTILHALLMAPLQILVTALALEHLARQGSKTGFGSLRLWGSIGFAISTFGIGALFVDAGTVWWILPLYAVGNLILGVIAYTFPDADVHGPTSWREGLGLLRQERPFLWFLLGLLLLGMTLGIVNNYISVYLVDIGGAGWMIGAALAISALCEVPLLAKVQSFIDRWGVRPMLLIGAAVLPLRWFLFAINRVPLAVLPIQATHSIAMMSLLVVAVLYVDRLLEPRWRTSGQALYTSSLHSVGPGIGLYLGGLIYGSYGIQTVWFFSLGVALVGVGILVYAIYGQPKRD
ncbi:MAG: MFS transporter [Anaerolineales bacterium]|nr:MFS transporter [Anaerolineales bacterium]